MEDSGLDNLWRTIYAGNSIPKMLDGKYYDKALRTALLTDAALLLFLEANTVERTEVDESENRCRD